MSESFLRTETHVQLEALAFQHFPLHPDSWRYEQCPTHHCNQTIEYYVLVNLITSLSQSKLKSSSVSSLNSQLQTLQISKRKQTRKPPEIHITNTLWE